MTTLDTPLALDPLPTKHAPAERNSLAELKRLARLIRGDQRLLTLIEGYPEICLILDEHRQIVTCNRWAMSLMGKSNLEAMIGERPGEAVRCTHATDTTGGCGTTEACRQCGAVNAILECQATGNPSRGECRITTNLEGPLGCLDLEAMVSPLQLDGVRLFIFAARDISDAKRRVVLERIFFHDVLNLAAAMIGEAEAWIPTADDLTTASMGRMGRLAKQTVEQIRAQRDLLYAERGELQPEWVPTCVRGILEELRDTFAFHPAARGRTLVIQEPDDAACALRTDPMLLRRVLVNLVKNALEAIEPGETVTLSCTGNSCDRITFAVHNPGVMPEQVQSQMFQRSFSTKSGIGRGIGSYSVKLLTTAHLRGQVGFSSNQREGTRFEVTLPAGDAAEMPASRESCEAESRARLDALRILLVEDGEDNRRLVMHHLQSVGAQVITAENGREALAAINANLAPGTTIDAILMDADMPVMDGFEATRQLRAAGYSRPIIALTAYDGRTARELEKAGCDHCLAKPVDRRQLIRTIRQLVAAPA